MFLHVIGRGVVLMRVARILLVVLVMTVSAVRAVAMVQRRDLVLTTALAKIPARDAKYLRPSERDQRKDQG